MFVALLCFQLIVHVLSKAPPAPPQNVHVDKWLMTWTPAGEDTLVHYSVQYSSLDSGEWKDVENCVDVSANQCNVTAVKDEDEQGCVMLRVHAETRRLKSVPVEACSQRGGPCSPAVSLTARPGFLTVHLSDNHSLAWEHGDHVEYRVYYGKEGESLQDKFKHGRASVSIDGLQEGQRYCIKVQFVYFEEPIGPPGCTRCELVPESEKSAGPAGVILAVMLVLFLLALVVVAAYFLIFHLGRIKRWLHDSRYQIPDDFFPEPLPDAVPASSPCEERYDIITSITQK